MNCCGEGFKLNEDFDIYSSYKDALNDKNPWEFCDGDATYRFPLNCKPKVTKLGLLDMFKQALKSQIGDDFKWKD